MTSVSAPPWGLILLLLIALALGGFIARLLRRRGGLGVAPAGTVASRRAPVAGVKP
jgi:F0F1-type ATP synthase assembly protein I